MFFNILNVCTVTSQCHWPWVALAMALTKDIVVIKIRILAELLFTVPGLDDVESQFDASSRDTKPQQVSSSNAKWIRKKRACKEGENRNKE